MNTMKKKPRSFARRLSRRIILVMLVANVFIIGAVLLFVFFGMLKQNGEHFLATMDYTDEKLETMLTAVEVTAVNNVAEVEAHLQQPEMVYEALEKELKLNTHVVGCFAAFDPGYFPEMGRWFEPYVVRRDSMRLERMQLGSASHDYLNAEWFLKGGEDDNGYWSDPYFDEVGARAMLCSYVLPIHDSQGRKVGVFGVDLPLEWLNGVMAEIEKKENAHIFEAHTDSVDEDAEIYSFIIGRNGEYIVHPDKENVLKKSYLNDVKLTPDTLDDYMCREMIAGRNGSLLMDIDGVTSYVFYSHLGHAGWSMAIVVPQITMIFWPIAIGVIVLFIMLLGMLAVFLISQISISRATKPLSFLNNSASEVAKGHFDTPLPHFQHNDEISQLRDSFETMQLSLSQYMEELKHTTASKASMESELRIAHSIQMSMLPKTYPAFPDRSDVDIYGLVNPAKAVGGDLYDFFIRDEKLFFCIGDVSGKGVPASLVMAVTRSLFRNISSHVAKPGQIVMTLNDSLSEGNDANMFVTMLVGVLDLPTGRLHYCNAGHDAPVVIHPQSDDEASAEPLKSENECEMLEIIPNLPLGVMPGMNFSEQEVMLSHGTTIFLYTDGLSEAEDGDFNQFGKDRILQVAATSSSSPMTLVDSMVSAVRQFVGNTEQNDDLTMLAVQYSWEHLANHLERSLTLPNDVQTVPQLAAFVDEVCEGVGFDMMMTMQMNLAMEEAVVNVMQYAYPAGVSGEVHICAEANDERLKFVITDEGVPFDPTAQGEVDTTLSAEERNIGGLGIHLVRNIMDSINYERVGGKNVFTLRKKLK